MPASQGPPRDYRTTPLIVLACVIALAGQPAGAQTRPAEAIEAARALERDGHAAEAELYLRELVANDNGLSRDASVLLELARLATSASESLSLIESALARTRDPELVTTALELRGDYLYAGGRYLEASAAYEQASSNAPRQRVDWILLKRASSLLALGDASAAAEAYEELASGGGVPGEVTPWAVLGLGQALIAGGNAEAAAVEFERAATAYPGHAVRPQALFGASRAHVLAGDRRAARAALETLLAEYPGTLEAVLAREDLRRLGEEPSPAGTDSTSSEGDAAGLDAEAAEVPD